MSTGPSYDTKQCIKEATDIVDLVGGYLQLRREGRGYKAICPWHDDSRPSLQINPERQSWKCWVCNLGGDVFSFLMQIESVAFPEARGHARRSRRHPASTHRQITSRQVPATDEKRQLFQAMAWAETQFHDCLLRDPAAEVARGYLAERGLSDDSVRRFRLGFAPDSWDWLLQRASRRHLRRGAGKDRFESARRPNGPGHYDRFRGRVLFPIYDPQSRPVGIGGRIAARASRPRPTSAKYINSPETPPVQQEQAALRAEAGPRNHP